MPARLWLCLSFALCLPFAVAAEEPQAFTILGAGGADLGEASPAAARSWQVSARLDVLRTAPPRLGLPLAAGVRTADLTEFERRAADSYTWRGRWTDGEGSVTLTVVGQELAGFIAAGPDVFELVPKGMGRADLVLLDSGGFPECGTSARHSLVTEEPLPQTAADAPQPLADSGGRIDVMVLYTPAARTGAGGASAIKAVAQAAVDAANTAYGNSQITQRLRLVHTQEMPYDEAGGVYEDYLDWITSDPAVAALRDAYRADLVDLLVQKSTYCGIGWLMNNVSQAFAGNGFSVTTRTCAVGNLSFAHELGHNMSAHHDPANAGGAVYPYAYGHFVNGLFRTVMSYNTQCTSGCTRVAYFSNPDVSYLGQPAGIADARDNHRALNNTAAVVANFRQEIQPGDLYTLTPCRVVDTRNGPALQSGVPRGLDVAGVCGIPENARAVVVNVTVASPTGLGNLTLYPSGVAKPNATTLNFMAGANRANSAILALPGDGSGNLSAEAFVAGGGSVHLVLDVTGYMATLLEDQETP